MNKVSVIIPLYNREALIIPTLESVRPNLHPNVTLEVIVINDGSTDNSSKVVSENYPWVKLLHQVNAGAPTARNLGLKESTGDFILFLDSDDLIEPDFFTDKVSALNNHPNAAAAYGLWEHFRVNEKEEKEIIPRHTPYPITSVPDYESHLENLLGGWYVVSHALLWRKKILEQLNGYNVALKVNQDVDLLFRCLSGRKNIIGVNAPLALYRDHDSTDRTGSVSNDFSKLATILNLRKDFAQKLSGEELLTNKNRTALGRFCFDYWVKYRKTSPDIAEQFYKLAIELNPNIKLNGGLTIRFACRLLGARKTIILKSFISN